jgi:hypothetical protein
MRNSRMLSGIRTASALADSAADPFVRSFVASHPEVFEMDPRRLGRGRGRD